MESRLMGAMSKGNYQDPVKMSKALHDITSYLHIKEVRFTLLWGTLLGYARDRKFIPWDSDIDIGVHSDDWDKLNIATIEKLGYKVNLVHRGFMQVDMQVKKPGYPMIDIYHMFPQKNYLKVTFDNYFPLSFYLSNAIKKIAGKPKKKLIIARQEVGIKSHLLFACGKPMYKLFPLVDFEYPEGTWEDNFRSDIFMGSVVYVPVLYHWWIELAYGKNWKTPNADYQTSRDRMKNRMRTKL